MHLFFRRLFQTLKDFLFPPVCSACNSLLPYPLKYVCPACEINFVASYTAHGVVIPKMQYLKENYNLQEAFALYPFSKDGSIEKMLYALKYREQKSVGVFFGKKLAAYLAENLPPFDGLIGVPLHSHRKNLRGYNQVDIIGQTVEELLSIPYYPSVLRRVVSTPPLSQTTCDRRIVLANAFAGCFGALPPGGHFLLMDDIFTTGATLEACLNVLSSSSHYRFSIATIAYRI